MVFLVKSTHFHFCCHSNSSSLISIHGKTMDHGTHICGANTVPIYIVYIWPIWFRMSEPPAGFGVFISFRMKMRMKAAKPCADVNIL